MTAEYSIARDSYWDQLLGLYIIRSDYTQMALLGQRLNYFSKIYTEVYVYAIIGLHQPVITLIKRGQLLV